MLDPVDAAALKFTQNALERCATPMLQKKFVALGGVDMLVHFISMSVNDEVVSSAALVLRMLQANSKEACMRVVKLGGPSSLLALLRRTRNNQVVLPVVSALRTLVEAWSMGRDDPTWDNVVLFESSDDAAEVLVELLKKANTDIRLEATSTLYHLCANDYDLVLRSSSCGAMESLTKTLREERDLSFVIQATNAICVLLASESLHDVFASCEGYIVLMDLLRVANHNKMAEQTARALSNFMCNHKAQTQVASVSGAEVFVSTLRKVLMKQIIDPEGTVVEQVCAAICNFTFENDANRIRVGEVGGCEVLVRVCQLSEQDRVLEQACAAIGNICKKNRTNRSLIGNAGGCEVLLRVISSSPPERTAVQAVRAIGNVAMRAPENQLKFAADNGLRLLLQLVETLSLKLIPTPSPFELELQKSFPSGNPRSPMPVGGSNQSSPLSSTCTTPRHRGAAQHEESFLQLTLSALSSLCSHDCCRCQLVYDLATKELLSRISRVSAHADTQNMANRLLSLLWIQDMQEESPADVEEVKPGSIHSKSMEGEASLQELPFESSSASTKKHSFKHSETGADDNDECWDPSDFEEDGIADHHSDACSVASFHSRSSAYSRDSSQFSRSSRRASSEQMSAEIDCEAEIDHEVTSSYASDHDSNRYSDVELNGFGGMFSEVSDDELDVEQLSNSGVRLTVNDFGQYHGREAGSRNFVGESSVRAAEEEMVACEGSASKDHASGEQGGEAVEASLPQSRSSQQGNSNLELLIAKRNLRLEIHDGGDGHGREREEEGASQQEPAMAACVVSSESYGLPPAMLNALNYRPLPQSNDVDLLYSRNLKQKLIDAWLDVAERSQRNKVALAKCRRQRDRRAVGENLKLWKEALITEESDNDTPRDHSEDALPSSDCSSSSCRAFYHETGDTMGTKSGNKTRCCCEGDSLSPDEQTPHPFLLDCNQTGGKDAADLMTVASEASTRSLGSENSGVSLYEWSAPCFCPALANCPVPPSPCCRSAEAALEASTKVMVSLLEKNGWAGKEQADVEIDKRMGCDSCRQAMWTEVGSGEENASS
ncbi:hypothetical protein GUITHDRAFT_120945 [Guillardia theta CCMP2712]|uniref:Vacuolar protein 8 n=2 Tax=Guillardia theta TaxID=55529 RepID=L1I9I7_GUITC|nr:hypothetical protein GUITHDRAFT_120945 [Guillardia theta CCMP2712]EKX32878.1 hypothetical protein GUITHDRAFT_120945 [Guillardia theta CCMP2712]|mmetsp:Transcript_42441/g.133694  ORF Transcript_42441/g.133694 Transcript_42441/m.133694 type:complete len:1059 (+) Transcript_42441:47-3223(+)|eukprot:XP_005819858.1 hypothetical protein GUITHDRAFT_120945 [Guillardia theta CCMP2712]